MRHQQHESHHLLITTPSVIYHCSRSQRRPLLECASADGILNARAAKDNSGLIAVADSHLVVLYDATHGREAKCRLESGHGDPRILCFSPSSRMLYFTTTLSPSIQAYSIPTAELLSPLQAHPSPPRVVAMSANGEILLSASPTPPTTFLQDLRMGGSVPVQFFPNGARSPVTCASFQTYDQPSQKQGCVFSLGFQDGTLATYKLALPDISMVPLVTHPDRVQALILRPPRKLGSFKQLHKAAMGGVCAADFVPGYKSRVVSIGHDGRCRLVDFDNGGSILRTWHVSGPATSLSVLSTGPVHTTGRKPQNVIFGNDSVGEERAHEGLESRIAVGTQAGKVLVFNILGLLVQEIAVDASVIGLEWVGDMTAPCLLPNRLASPMPTHPNGLCSSTSPVADMLMDEDEQVSDEEASGTVKKTNRPPRRHSGTDNVSIGQALDLFSPSPRATSVSQSDSLQANKQSEVAHMSPYQQERTVKRSKRAYSRPRIVTETFKTPNPPPSVQCFSANPISHPKWSTMGTTVDAAMPVIQDARRWSPVCMAPEAPVKSGVLDFDSATSDSTQASSDVGEEIRTMPLTKEPSRISLRLKSPRKSVVYETRCPPQERPSQRSSRHPSCTITSGRHGHQVSFASTQFPPSMDMETDDKSRQGTYSSPIAAPPRPRPRKRFRFDEKRDGMDGNISNINGSWESIAEGEARREDDEGLVREIRALRQEVSMLKEAVLASRCSRSGISD